MLTFNNSKANGEVLTNAITALAKDAGIRDLSLVRFVYGKDHVKVTIPYVGENEVLVKQITKMQGFAKLQLKVRTALTGDLDIVAHFGL